jgi:hypothetical protein
MRGQRIFRVNILSRRPAQAHSVRMGTWRWNVMAEESVIASGESPSKVEMRRETLEVQKDYLRRHPNLKSR